jgi:signal transduction histidine kinase
MHGLTGTLQRHIEHIRTIVSVQQNYAKSPSIIEATCLDDLIADALRINAAALGRHEVSIKQELAELPRVMLDKHQVLQILLNLISNAKYAVSENASNDRQIILRLERTDNNVIRIQVSDNGIGIKPEHLTGIFQHGFTTRKDGHGFGLHSSAIAARAMGGSLSAQSDGPGCGATFTFELPLQPEHVA